MSEAGTDPGTDTGVTPRVLVLMGVSGVGKTTIAEALDAHLHWPFQEGDELHPPRNVEKMRAGQPLTDADREPWLRAVAAWIEARIAAGEHGIITCSALKRHYRDIIVRHPEVRIVYLQADRQVIQDRLARRTHHYMPASLLDSQLDTLEEPTAEEHPMVVQVHRSVEETVSDILAELGQADREAK